MKPIRKFIVNNYYDTKTSKNPIFPWVEFNWETKKFSFKWLYGSYPKVGPKIFLTMVLYGILQIIVAGGPYFVWWLALPTLFLIFLQYSWSSPFYGYSYNDRHPLTEEEKLELSN